MKNDSAQHFAQQLSRAYEQARVPDFPQRHFPPELFYDLLDRIAGSSAPDCSLSQAGTSFEGRGVRLVRIGKGVTTVLLWSQMHGDEPTATMALADLISYLGQSGGEASTRRMLSSLTLCLLPMLNPDGASRTQRRTAQNIDMNRDALALVTPEARILKKVREEVKPAFGFNLHDQELSTVGTSKELTALALLAPAFDETKSDNEVRRAAKEVAAVFLGAVGQFVPGRIARYDDAFEPRAFGDNMQKWGTSTVLVESGHIMGDGNKETVRKLNFIGILASLDAIASGAYRSADTDGYERLPLNGKKAYDLIIRDVRIAPPSGEGIRADLAVSYQVDTHSEATPRLADLGDLSTFTALREIAGGGKTLSSRLLSIGEPFAWEEYF